MGAVTMSECEHDFPEYDGERQAVQCRLCGATAAYGQIISTPKPIPEILMLEYEGTEK